VRDAGGQQPLAVVRRLRGAHSAAAVGRTTRAVARRMLAPRTPTLPTNRRSDTHTGCRSSFSLRTAARQKAGPRPARLSVPEVPRLVASARGTPHAQSQRARAPVASTFTSDTMRSTSAAVGGGIGAEAGATRRAHASARGAPLTPAARSALLRPGLHAAVGAWRCVNGGGAQEGARKTVRGAAG
jgi:hypothetical protein